MTDFNFNFDFDFSGKFKSPDVDTRYYKPKKIKGIKENQVKYEHAEQMVDEVGLIGKNERVFSVIAGSFIFGDLIEAYIVKHNLGVKSMTISTLSLSEDNVDSLANLLNGGFLEELNIVVSDYFYSHEKHRLIKYMYENLDIDNKFQLAVARVHTKICIFETDSNLKYVFHGSANLRSSDNIEQLMLEESEQLYDFNKEWHDSILDEYLTINKSLGGKKLWQIVETEDQEEVREEQKDALRRKSKNTL